MNRSLNFFFWTVWSSEALAAVASASTPDPRGPDCVARMRRRLRSFGVAERSKRKAGGAARLSAAPSPGPAAPGMAGHVPLSESSRSEAEGPSPPARDAPGRVGSGGFGAGGVRQGAPPLGILPAGQSLRADAGQRSPWTAPMTMAARLHSSSMATARMAVSMARASPIHHSR